MWLYIRPHLSLVGDDRKGWLGMRKLLVSLTLAAAVLTGSAVVAPAASAAPAAPAAAVAKAPAGWVLIGFYATEVDCINGAWYGGLLYEPWLGWYCQPNAGYYTLWGYA